MMITKYEFRGEKDGISLLILAAVHGNETAGTQACFRIIDEFNRGALRLTGGAACLTSFLPNVTISNVSVTDKEKKN